MSQMIEPSDARQPVSDVLARELAVRFHAMAPPGFRAGKRPKPRVRSKLPVCLVSCRYVTDAVSDVWRLEARRVYYSFEGVLP